MIALLVKIDEGWEFWGWLENTDSALKTVEQMKQDNPQTQVIAIDPEGAAQRLQSGECPACGRS